MRFDWYGASVEAAPERVLADLCARWDLASVRPARPRNGFERGAQVHRGDRVLAHLFWENPASPNPYLVGSGPEAPAVAEYLRGSEFDHRVSRADVCEDYTAPGAWADLSGRCLKVADRHGVKVRHAGDWHRGIDGRTIYLGGQSSVVQARCYEKGRQLQKDPDWVRVEVQVNPKGKGKALAARAAPLGLFAGSRWSSTLATELGAPDVVRMAFGTVYRPDDVLRSREAVVRQYGPTLRDWAAELGGFRQLALKLEEEIG